jgi:hypothetical protein
MLNIVGVHAISSDGLFVIRCLVVITVLIVEDI